MQESTCQRDETESETGPLQKTKNKKKRPKQWQVIWSEGMSQYADTWRDLHIILLMLYFTRVPVAQAVGAAFGFDVSQGRGRWCFFVVQIPFCLGHLTGSRCTVLKIRDDAQVPALISHLASLSITPNLVFDVATFAPELFSRIGDQQVESMSKNKIDIWLFNSCLL